MFFGRKRRDVVDLTDMRKRGILKDAIPETNEEGLIDFRGKEINPAPKSAGYADFSSGTSNTPDMDFLGSLAGASNAAASSSGGSIIENLREARQRNLNPEINELKIKVEDSDYKIRVLQDRIKELERKLGERHL